MAHRQIVVVADRYNPQTHDVQFAFNHVWYNQYLALNKTDYLRLLAEHLGVQGPIHYKKKDLITLIQQRLIIDIPDELKAKARGPLYIYYRFREVPQVYFRLNQQTETGGISVSNREYDFPPRNVGDLKQLCRVLFNLPNVEQLKKEELRALLEEKVVLQERGS